MAVEVADGSQSAASMAMSEELLKEIGCGGFAIGACDAKHLQVPIGLTVKGFCQKGHGFPGFLGGEDGDLKGHRFRSCRQNGAGAQLTGMGNEVVSILIGADECHKQRSRPYPPAVVGQMVHLAGKVRVTIRWGDESGILMMEQVQ